MQTLKSVRFNKKTPSPVFGIGQRMSYIKLPFVSLKMLARVVRELCPQNWSMMDVAGSDINNRGITRQTHGPLSDNCHIWDQFTIQNTTVTQLSITNARVRKYHYVCIYQISRNSFTIRFFGMLNLFNQRKMY